MPGRRPRVKILERVADGRNRSRSQILAREYRCSEMTIRRDITRLERDGFPAPYIRRSHGPSHPPLDVAFNARALANARGEAAHSVSPPRSASSRMRALIYLGIAPPPSTSPGISRPGRHHRRGPAHCRSPA